MSPRKHAVLLLAHGSPDSADEVPEFMKHITAGRTLPAAVIEEVRHRYALIGKSPLTEISMAQAEALRRAVNLPVYLGMRNWRPFIADVARQLASDRIEHVIALCLAPQNSSTSTGLYQRALLAEIKAAEVKPDVTLDFIPSWHDHPLLARAFAEKLEIVWRQASNELGSSAPVIFTAHSVPMSSIQAGDPYEHQAKETAAMVAGSVAGLSQDLRRFAFQSQGMSGGPWLGPTVESVVLELKRHGHAGVVIAPIGFVCDHVEILYDIDIAFRQFAQEQGMKLWRPESLNASPTFIAAMANLISARVDAAMGAASQV
jgi:protoporphyrin/coproporphyrin ferrochelatase